MRLPGAAAYMEAVQDPGTCFADPELAGASPALGPLGLPRAVSGNVAVVFRLDGPAGRSWAVRCFVRPLEGERARYDALRAHLASLDSSWRVGFDLQPLGIRVEGAWWPLVKMEWAPGEPLLAYVQRHLWDGAALGYLAARVVTLAERLRADGVAHGDLQHGNILVAPGGDLRLVDYDGMYVPALDGWSGTERGHRNYQHPGRAVSDFGPGLDAFSAWSIYASIASLAADPLLWGRLDGGEEALLLRHHDLEHPDRSAALAAMEASDGPGVAELAGLLRSFLAVRPDEVPPLSRILAPTPACLAPVRGPESCSLYEALAAAGTADAATPRPAPGPAVEFGGDLSEARRTVAGFGSGTVLALATVLIGVPLLVTVLVAAVAAVAGLARVRRLFLLTPEARAAHEVGAVLAEPRQVAGDAVAAVDRLGRRRLEVSTSEEAAARTADVERARLRGQEDAELRQVDAALEASLAGLGERERAIGRSEKQARAAALAELQASVVDAQLAKHSLVAASAVGVSEKVVYRLALDDVRTAADFTEVKVEKKCGVVVRRDGRRLRVNGVDQRQADVMVQWRRRVAGAAQLKVPDVLPPERLAAIRAEHDRLRSVLAAEEESARTLARTAADEIRARWRSAHDAIVQRQKQVEADAARQRVDLDRDLARARKDAAEAEWRLGRHQDEAGGPGELRLADYLRQVAAVGPLAAVLRRPAPGASPSSTERTPSPRA